jgi:ATP-binding cassette subfamily B multidrug efflux pump
MRSLLRLRPYLQPYRLQIILSLITLLLLTAASMVIPALIQQVIDVGLKKSDARFLINIALLIITIGAARACITYANRYINEWISNHIGYDLRNRLYDHIQYLPFTYHDHAQAGQLISRCIEDVRAIERFAGSAISELIRISILMIGITTLLFIETPRLAAIALIPIIPLLWIATDFGRRISTYFYAVDNAIGDLSARLQENVSGVQVVHAFAREPYEIQRFSVLNRILYKARVRVFSEWSKVMPTTNLLVYLGLILVLWFGGQMVLQGDMTIGELVAFNSYMMMLGGPVGQLTWLVNTAGEAVAGARRTFEVLDTIPEIKSPSSPNTFSNEEDVLGDGLRVEFTRGTRPYAAPNTQISGFYPPSQPVLWEEKGAESGGKVVFDHVSFRYQGEKISALDDIHLTVEPNQKVALIGPTGSGKTSLVNLIPRFYDVTAGSVQVDGLDVREMNLTTLRRQIGIVLQTSLLFSVSVKENIAYGRPDATLDEIIEAAKAAQAHEFILELPQGYDIVVGERGITLSGGQRQRIAIARALLMNPHILILDDSTSSVDTQTERLIQKALNRLMEGRTTFIIAHRLSTVRRADRILVMDQGRIAEQGTHTELLALNGLYREIYNLQLHDQERFREEAELLNNGATPSVKSHQMEAG